MNVKNVFTYIKGVISRYFLLFFACIFLAIAYMLLGTSDDGLLEKQKELAMRAIGDDLLKQDHDYHTSVPPIQQLNPVTLRIKFENPISINPDKLLDISLKHLNSKVSLNSIVNIINADTEEVVYGFEINHLAQKDIPCLGRSFPNSSYWVDVSFYDHLGIKLSKNIPAISCGGISLFLLVVYGFTLHNRKEEYHEDNGMLEFNGIKLDPRINQLLYGNMKIQLTEKEFQIIKILSNNNGQLVSREQLVQEVWLRNGVVTGRSLDMYISRLRKKIINIPNAQILNQRGKGYMLKIE